MYKLVFFVPASHLESVKKAVFDTGAGSVGDYEQCCWQALGQGQFYSKPSAQPFIGKRESLTYVEEYRVEMVCADEYVRQAYDALKAAHPYEEPAIDVWALADFL